MKKLLLLSALLISLSVGVFAQQDYVGRYDFFTGFSYLNSPKLDLQQRGFNTQIGVNLTRWLAFGFDYSIQFGRASIVTSDLKDQYQTLLDQAVQAGIAGAYQADGVPPLPSNYLLWAPFDATTQTYTGGPQLNFRQLKKVTFFVHPSIGAIHENISITPPPDDATYGDFVAKIIIPGLVASNALHSTRPNDTTYFYGFGGGADYNLTKHVHLRADAEFVHVYLFSNLLHDARNSVRLSIGPSFSFGSNVKKH